MTKFKVVRVLHSTLYIDAVNEDEAMEKALGAADFDDEAVVDWQIWEEAGEEKDDVDGE